MLVSDAVTRTASAGTAEKLPRTLRAAGGGEGTVVTVWERLVRPKSGQEKAAVGGWDAGELGGETAAGDVIELCWRCWSVLDVGWREQR